MTLVVPFVHYSGTSKETSRKLFEFMEPYLVGMMPYVKEIVIIDSGDFIGDVGRFTVINKPFQGHWDNLEQVLPVIEDDSVLLIDSDTIIYDAKLVAEDLWFLYNSKVDLVAATDGSGQYNHPKLAENTNRPQAQRFTPYFMGFKTRVMNTYLESGGTLAPVTLQGMMLDSFGEFSVYFLDHEYRFLEIQDDRTTVMWGDDGISVENWSIVPGYNFSTLTRAGWYHIRNIGAGLRMADTMQEDAAMPTFELVRLCWWAQIITGKDMSPVALGRISKKDWNDYQRTAREIHAY